MLEVSDYLGVLRVVIVAVLLERFGSKVSEVTVAVFTMLALPRTRTVTVRLLNEVACAPRLPNFQVTVPAEPTAGAVIICPFLFVAFRKTVPWGVGSLMITFFAVEGPRLLTVIV